MVTASGIPHLNKHSFTMDGRKDRRQLAERMAFTHGHLFPK